MDAFTRVPLGGNPAAVIFDADDLTPSQMQAVAREMNLSETAFVMRSTVADFKVRFSPPIQRFPWPDIRPSPPSTPWPRPGASEERGACA